MTELIVALMVAVHFVSVKCLAETTLDPTMSLSELAVVCYIE